MEKIKQLLSKIGASDELADSLCEEINRHSAALKRQYDEEFQRRIERAKSICLEEVEKYQSDLSRKVGIFLESKSRAIDEAAERQRKIEESEAAASLRRIAAIATGGDPNAVGDTERDLQAALRANKRLERQMERLREEREGAIRKANNLNKIAENALEANKRLEQTLKAEGVENLPPALRKKAEEKKAKAKKETGVADGTGEETQDECGCEDVQKPKAKRIDESRQVAKPKSARPTLAENQTRKPVDRKFKSNNTIDKIADDIQPL